MNNLKLIKNCIDLFSSDKDSIYLNFVYEILLKTKKEDQIWLRELFYNYLVKAISKKSVPMNVMASSNVLKDFFSYLTKNSFLESKELENKKNNLKLELENLNIFSENVIKYIDNSFNELMIDTFYEFSNLTSSVYYLKSADMDDSPLQKINEEFKTYSDNQDIVENFIDKPLGFYLVKKYIKEINIVKSYSHAIVSKTNGHILIIDINYEKVLSNTMSGVKKYKFNDFIYKDYETQKELNKELSNEKGLIVYNKNEESIYRLKEYNLLVLISLMFMINNQYVALIKSSTCVNNYVVEKKDNYPVCLQVNHIEDITLKDVEFKSSLVSLNLIEKYYLKYLSEKVDLINFKPKDYDKNSLYIFYRFNSLDCRKRDFNHIEIVKKDLAYAQSYGLIPELIPLQSIGMSNEDEYKEKMINYGMYNKLSLLEHYHKFNSSVYKSKAFDYVQKLLSDNTKFFFDNIDKLTEKETIGTKIKEYNDFRMKNGGLMFLSEDINFINNKKIKALNKDVYADKFRTFNLTVNFIDVILENFSIPEEYKVFLLAYKSNKELKSKGYNYVVYENFDFSTNSVYDLAFFESLDFAILIPWK